MYYTPIVLVTYILNYVVYQTKKIIKIYEDVQLLHNVKYYFISQTNAFVLWVKNSLLIL